MTSKGQVAERQCSGLAGVVALGAPMHDESFRIVCCVGDCGDAPAITSVQLADGCCDIAAVNSSCGIGGELWLLSPIRSRESDAGLLFEVKSFLWCKRERYPIPSNLQRVWDDFYQQYESIVWRQVEVFCGSKASVHELADYYQSVWLELSLALPKLNLDPLCGSLSGWVSTVTRRTLRRLRLRVLRLGTPHRRPIGDLEDSLPSPDLGPQGMYHFRELRGRLARALRALQRLVSPLSYDVFRRHFVRRQAIEEIASALDLTIKAAKRHRERAVAKCCKKFR